MKKPFSLLMIALAAVAFTACEKEEEKFAQAGQQTGNNQGSEKNYYYNLYTEYENLNASNMDIFDALCDVNDQGDLITWMATYRGTREACDNKAIAAFDSILSLIDDQKACAGLHGTDYMKAIMQRVEGGPHDLKKKVWKSTGTE